MRTTQRVYGGIRKLDWIVDLGSIHLYIYIYSNYFDGPGYPSLRLSIEPTHHLVNGKARPSDFPDGPHLIWSSRWDDVES